MIVHVPMQDLSRLQLDLVQPYMLPWDARHFVACISDLFSEDRFYSTLEPSLFCSPGSTASLVWPAGMGQDLGHRSIEQA